MISTLEQLEASEIRQQSSNLRESELPLRALNANRQTESLMSPRAKLEEFQLAGLKSCMSCPQVLAAGIISEKAQPCVFRPPPSMPRILQQLEAVGMASHTADIRVSEHRLWCVRMGLI